MRVGCDSYELHPILCRSFFLLEITVALVIAETTFITKQGSGLAAVDVYGDIDKSPKSPGGSLSGLPGNIKTPNMAGEINKITDLFTKAMGGKSTEDAIKGVRDILKNKDKLLDNLKEGLYKDVLTNVGLGPQAGDITDVLAGRKDPKTLLGTAAGYSPQMKIVVNGVEKILAAKELGTATGVVNLLTELTGNTELGKVLNLAPEFLLYGSLLGDATKLRMPELIDVIFEKSADVDQREKVMITGIPTVVANSDIETLEKIATTLGNEALVAIQPDIIPSILTNYKTLSGLPPTPADVEQLTTMLERIDTKWLTYNRYGVDVVDLSVLNNLSPHAYEALRLVPEVKDVLALVGLYKTQTLGELLHTYKPWIKSIP